MVSLHVLGTAGYHGNGFRETTCLAIPEIGVVLDAGTGFYRLRKLLPKFPVNVPIQAFISHDHLDHVIGLTQTLTTLRGHHRPLEVFASANHLSHLDKMMPSPLFPLSMERLGLVPRPLKWLNAEHAEVTSNETLHVHSCVVPHPGDSTAYRLELSNGHSIGYITDTEAQYVRRSFVSNVNTLIHECNFPDSMKELAEASGHSTLSEVLRLAERGRVGKLVLMHFNNFPEMESGEAIENLVGEMPKELPCEVVLTHDNMVVEV